MPHTHAITLGNYLIVDDDRTFADFVVAVIERAYPASSPMFAASGSSALGVLKLFAGDIDLVLMDYVMTGMDGIECLKQIRVDHPLLPVVMLTGMVSDELVTEAMDAGADDYVVKDHLRVTLPHVIWSVLVRHKAALRSKKRTDEAATTLLAILRKLRDVVE